VVGGIGRYPTRTVAYLSDRAAYTFDDKGNLVRYDPAAGTIERPGPRVPNGGLEADLQTVFALCKDRDRRRLYGVSTLLQGEKNERMGGRLFEYDCHTGRMEDLGSAAHFAGSSTAEADLYHAITCGPDGTVYYWAPTRGKPVHLVSDDPGSGSKTDLGELRVGSEDAFVLGVFAACTGLDGRLYFGGLLKSERNPGWAREAVLMIVDPCGLG
jgi:hypothetical protein